MKVKFVPQNIELEIRPGQTVLHLARENDIHIQSVCKGIPSCAECRVRVTEGEYNVVPPSEKELSLVGTAQFVDQSRLACQLRCFGDITVDLTEQIEKAERTVKRPRGRLNRFGDDEDEGQKTRAVMGNLVLSEFDIEAMEDEEAEAGGMDRQGQSAPPQEISRPSFYDNTHERNSKKASSSPGRDPQSGSGRDANRPSRDKEARRRNRNRKR